MENNNKRITDYFGEYVFNDEVMQEYMSPVKGSNGLWQNFGT